MKYRHGLTVARLQPLHLGHARTIKKMLDECSHVTLVLGSMQEYKTEKNPFTFLERRKMVHDYIYSIHPQFYEGEQYQITGVPDINNPQEWADFVLHVVYAQTNFLEVDAYYAGSEYDANWFKGKVPNIEIVNRVCLDQPYVSATLVREMVMYGDPRWRDLVPETSKPFLEEYKLRRK